MDVAVDPAGRVHAEERERRIGHRVDQPADQVGGGCTHVRVLAPERDDPNLRIGAGGRRQFVAPQSGARHRLTCQQLATWPTDDHFVAAPVEGVHRVVGEDLDAGVGEQPPELFSDETEVADAGRRHVEGGNRPYVRFVPSELVERELIDRDAVEAATANELRHPRQLVG